MSLLLLSLALTTPAPADTVRYAITFPNPAHHEARIMVDFPPAGDTLEVWMCRPSPGSYALHEFAKNVYDVRATDRAGRSVPMVRRNPYRWLVLAARRPVRFSYTLYGDWTDGTYTQIDRTHAHLNMPATFAWARAEGATGGGPLQPSAMVGRRAVTLCAGRTRSPTWSARWASTRAGHTPDYTSLLARSVLRLKADPRLEVRPAELVGETGERRKAASGPPGREVGADGEARSRGVYRSGAPAGQRNATAQ